MQVQPGLVTVIIPTYNRAATIREAVDSALAQSYSKIEVIVIDDGSTDETYQILKAYHQERKIVYLTQANSGAAAARNRGIKSAHGEYIAFLDADDRWLPEKLAKQLSLFVNDNVALVYSDMTFTGARTGLYSSIIKKGYRRGSVLVSLISENFIPTSSVVVRSISLNSRALSFFDDKERAPVGEDYYLWLHIAAVGEVDFVNEPLVEYAVHSGQLSGDPARTYKSLCFLFKKIAEEPDFFMYRKQLLFRRFTSYFKGLYHALFG